MNVKRDHSADPIDLTIDGNEYVALRTEIKRLRTALEHADAFSAAFSAYVDRTKMQDPAPLWVEIMLAYHAYCANRSESPN